MGNFKPLSWYCEPTAYSFWGRVVNTCFGSYTPCAIDSLVVSVSHLVLLGLCLYRIWLTKNDLKAQRLVLRSNLYNHILGLLAGFVIALSFLRLVMGISIFNLDNGQTSFSPFEVRFSIILIYLSVLVFLFLIFSIIV